MANTRLSYNNSPLGGEHVANAIRFVLFAQQEIALAMEVANSITGGGASPADLEGSVEFGVAVGQGSTFYTDCNNLKANLANVTAANIGDLYQG